MEHTEDDVEQCPGNQQPPRPAVAAQEEHTADDGRDSHYCRENEVAFKKRIPVDLTNVEYKAADPYDDEQPSEDQNRQRARGG